MLGVRPEKIRLLELHEVVPDQFNRMPGTVRAASYMGVSTQYQVEVPGDRRITVFEQNVERASKAELWEPGEEVVVAWQPQHSFVVKDEGAAAVVEESEEQRRPPASESGRTGWTAGRGGAPIDVDQSGHTRVPRDGLSPDDASSLPARSRDSAHSSPRAAPVGPRRPPSRAPERRRVRGPERERRRLRRGDGRRPRPPRPEPRRPPR